MEFEIINIKCNHKHNFEIRDPLTDSNFETEYDILSIMHYSPYAFAINSNKLTKNQADQNKMGQRSELSAGDIKRLRNMYQC